ncbi:DsbA family oxidoreductase [Shimia biformata]|uniref:DsbA family oxidoreductase n=1 Tax=Shimia biformata TaxID=1294299 RepID=UPI00194E790D|nr:DsbA family oxidoreductase [Shimia biformata]
MQDPIRVDIVSDVVCPWCVIGYRQLAKASAETGIAVDVYWHPFELNPQMAPEGENIREHIMRKFGSSAEDSARARQRLSDLGETLGFPFQWRDDSRIYNTFDAHRLLHWASLSGQTHDLKQALFAAYFSEGRDVSDRAVLVDVANKAGFDADQARQVLDSGQYADEVREKETFWTSRGISGVPAMVFEAQHLITGAQGEANYANILQQLIRMRTDTMAEETAS